jgi:hypothetical protein
LRKKDKAIKAGGLEPVVYLSDHGRATKEYDDDQVEKIKEQIDKIKRVNAELCQLQYSATKGGFGGQGKCLVQLLNTARFNDHFYIS